MPNRDADAERLAQITRQNIQELTAAKQFEKEAAARHEAWRQRTYGKDYVPPSTSELTADDYAALMDMDD